MTKSFNKGIAAAALTVATLTPTSGFMVLPSTKQVSRNGKGNGLPKLSFASNYNKKALRMSDNDEVADLLAAAAKMREDADRLAKEMGKDPVELEKSTATATTVAPSKTLSESEVLSLTSKIDFSAEDASSQAQKLNDLVSSGELSLWNSAASPSSTALRTYPVTMNFLESRSDGKITAKALGVDGEDDVSLDDFKMSLLYVTIGSSIGAVTSLIVGGNIGSTLCYLFALIPILFVGIGSSAPGVIAAGIQALRGSSDDDEVRNERICRHEAGHFLCGYLCGLPIKNYELTDTGFPCVEFHPSSEMNAVTGQREFTKEEIAALSVVALSGSVAEALKYEEAKGGGNDLLELENIFGRSKEFLGAAKQQDLTRWGALASYQLIKANMDKYEKLVQAFKEKKSVAECIAIIEGN